VEEIGAARRSFGGSSGPAALHTRERRGMVRGEEEMVLILYRAEGEREEAVRRWRVLAGRPLMAAAVARDRRVTAHVEVRRGCGSAGE
jgi:hypothetical protein